MKETKTNIVQRVLPGALAVVAFACAGPDSAFAQLHLTANDPLKVNQGASAVITSNHLAAAASGWSAAEITFTVGPTNNGGPPHQGWLRLSGNLLVAGGTFTQDDIDQGRLSYQHDDSNETTDDFQFNVRAPSGEVIPGPPYVTYSFAVEIKLVNHAPVAGLGSGSTGYGVPFQGTLPATDRDLPPQTLHFRVLTNGIKGTLVLTDTNSGAFVYTPNASERGSDVVTFQVSDGQLDSASPGIYTITMKPVAFANSYLALESSPLSGVLSATNAISPHTLTYRPIVESADKVHVVRLGQGMRQALVIVDELEELSRQRYVPASTMALCWLGLGDHERALAVGGHSNAVAGLGEGLQKKADVGRRIVDHQDRSVALGVAHRPVSLTCWSTRRTPRMSNLRASRRTSS